MMVVQVIAVNKSGRYAEVSVIKVNPDRRRRKTIETGKNYMRHGITMIIENE